jgi:DNA repair ATPase RecN
MAVKSASLLKKQPEMATPGWEKRRPAQAPVSKVEVPLEASRALERKVQELRASVLHLAKALADKRGPTAEIIASDIAEALREVAESGKLRAVRADPALLARVSAEGFDRLDHSLDSIRMSVIETASGFSTEDDPSKAAPLSAAMVMAWTAVWDNSPLRMAALTGA